MTSLSTNQMIRRTRALGLGVTPACYGHHEDILFRSRAVIGLDFRGSPGLSLFLSAVGLTLRDSVAS